MALRKFFVFRCARDFAAAKSRRGRRRPERDKTNGKCWNRKEARLAGGDFSDYSGFTMSTYYALKKHIALVSEELGIKTGQVERTAELLAEQATVPFISRYRKEATGGLDETVVQGIGERLEKLEALEKRRAGILSTIEDQGALTEELRSKITGIFDPRELEDIYLPYKPKRRTRAAMAREKGLEALADKILSQDPGLSEKNAADFISAEVPTIEEALAGARDIIAERVSEDAGVRAELRSLFTKEALLFSKSVKKKEKEGAKYRDYFEWSEPLKKCPAHRFLAMQRGAREAFLRIRVELEEERALGILEKGYLKNGSWAAEQVRSALKDAYARLLAPSLENEFLGQAKEAADGESIRVFAENLRQLLMAAPLGRKRVMALDPGYRTGCKVVCLDEQGGLLHHDLVFPHEPQKLREEAAKKLQKLAEDFHVEAVAIGDGTAGRETEELVRGIAFRETPSVFLVNEDGASVYSASAEARREFPDQDVTVRGAVSIGRRLMDPLSELVKIDPRSIGVGQYQHDVDQKRLRESLDGVVMSCVNSVGVDLNTAGQALLKYVSGLGPKLAEAVEKYRNDHGAFKTREELLEVPGMGPKAFQQAAGFLRIPDSANPLDRSAVHPESYPVVERMAADMGCGIGDLMASSRLRDAVVLQNYATGEVGLPTLRDIMEELARPGRDPRPRIEEFRFDDSVHTIEDLKEGMVLPGIVTNITRFGAFVDLGVKQDGLVHISELADRFVKDPGEVVKLQQKLRVKVLEVDRERGRIGLSLKPV
jgi:uncharacterized protein